MEDILNKFVDPDVQESINRSVYTFLKSGCGGRRSSADRSGADRDRMCYG